MTIHDDSLRSALAHDLTRRSLIAAAPGIAILPVLAPATMAQETPVAATPAATPSFADLDALLAAVVDSGVPGIALAVERAGELVFSGAAGVARVEDQTPVQPTDRFRIYSITKTFVATLVLQLVDDGLVSLDDTVASVLDDPAVAKIPNVDTATVRQLLNHTSGIYDYLDQADTPFYDDAFFAPDADWSRVWTLPELLAYADAANHDPYFAPGESGHYSNTGYLLLGMIVEQATGNTFADELGARILTPLSLKDTSFEMGKTLPDDVVDGYQLIDGELVNVTAVNLTWSWSGGAMVSTTADLQRFAQAVFTGELMSQAAFDERFTFHADPSQGVEGFEWGMGILHVPTQVGVVVGNEGDGGGGTSHMYHHADGDITVTTLANWAPDDGRLRSASFEVLAWTLANTP
jgi:D-alanyl-D-alanine carboxypeptidase